MIVRLMGEGQSRVKARGSASSLNELNDRHRPRWRPTDKPGLDEMLDEMWQLVRDRASAFPTTISRPPSMIIPPSDLTLEETRNEPRPAAR